MTMPLPPASLSDSPFSVRRFGAVGDGKTDDTAAIQKAIDAASTSGGGGVWFPPGQYACSTLFLKPYVGLFGQPTWSYHHHGGTHLTLIDPKAPCLVDISAAYGTRIWGLGMNGAKLGQGVHGVFLDGTKHNQEDTCFIEHCRISLFTGDAMHLSAAFGFTVRAVMAIFNDGDGLNYSKWDGWVYDCIFNNNDGWGIHGRPWNGSVTILGNRIEWNHKGGVLLSAGGNCNINDNYIDRSGGPGVRLDGGLDVDRTYGRRRACTINGNVFHRSGARVPLDSPDNCHIYLENQAGIVCTSNAMTTGVDDSGQGQHSPTYGIVCQSLRNCVIKDNTYEGGVTKEFLVNRGDVDASVIIKDNVGTPAGAEVRRW